MSYIPLSVNLHSRMGDFHRYLAEFATGDKQKDSADKSLTASDVASLNRFQHTLAVLDLPSSVRS
jgi:hypothetical protein